MEEEKTVADCFTNHGAQISSVVDWPESLLCRMGNHKCILLEDGGFKCSVCPNAYYCKNCYMLQMEMLQSENGDNQSERASNVGDPEEQSSLMEDGDELIKITPESGTELNRNFLKAKEREEWKRLSTMFGSGEQQQKKRDSKAGV